jgi:hypothetical protein
MSWFDWNWSRIMHVSEMGAVTSIETTVFAPILALLLLTVILIQHFAHRSRAVRTVLITLAFAAAACSALWPSRITQPEEVSRATGTGGSMLTSSSLATIPGIAQSTIDLAALQSLHASPTGDRDLATLLLTQIDEATTPLAPPPSDSFVDILAERKYMAGLFAQTDLGLDQISPDRLDQMNVVFCLDDPSQISPYTAAFSGGGGGRGRFGPAGLPTSANSTSTLWNWPVRILGMGTVDVPPQGRGGAATMGPFFSPQTSRFRWFDAATSTLHVTTIYPRETWPIIGMLLLPGVLFAAIRRHLWTRRRRAWEAAARCGSCGYSLEGLE